ncbi:MAG: hypothetical protein ABDH37_08475 [Candidatus Hydrothermales bacterium]
MNNILILVGSKELALALLRFFIYVFDFRKEDIYYFTFKDFNIVPEDIVKKSILWIIEGFNPEEPENPVGWRTAKKCGKKVLVFFLSHPDCSKEELKVISNKHFISFYLDNLKRKIEEVINNEKPKEKDFEEVENIWNALKYEPTHHHHRI